ncbi:SDR family oxidoreductase [Nocardiopsis tropica]|uniref:SDR family oxidoreductase n=1 Tax=Tsukamurella strandjordii TaxID=147577 RepID=UPI0031DE862E
MTGVAGRTVVVTGANGALGQAVTALLVERGARVAVISRGEADSALTALDGVRAYRADLSDDAATAEAARSIVADHGGIDGVLHLVGGWRGGVAIEESDPADWDFLDQGLIRSLQCVTRAFYAPLAASSDARLAIISSTAVAKPTAKNAMYASAKAASEAWILALADAFGDGAAAATALRVMALLTPQMREASPERKFPRYTPIETVAQRLVGLWDVPAAELNGTVHTLIPGEENTTA